MPFRILFALCLALLSLPAAAVTHVTVWNYYNSLPFYNPVNRDGLAPALVSYLNVKLAGRYQLELRTVPRARLNFMLEQQHEQGAVLLAPSVVFDLPRYKAYKWSPPILHDRQELVSPADSPVEFSSPDTLKTLRLGGMLGHNYPALQQQVDAGTLSIYRVSNEGQLFDMLLAGRLDAGTMAATSLDYWAHTHTELAPRLHRSSRNLGQFTRHLLYSPGMGLAQHDIDKVLREAAGDPAWLAIFATYGLAPLAHH